MIACSRPEAEHYLKEIHKCRKSPAYFLDAYASIYDATSREWIPFRLWPAQIHTLQTITDSRLVVVLKARQLGLTWLVLGFTLWLMLLDPAATVLLFSRRDDEAVDLLGTRLRGMYERLPKWLKVQSFGVDNDHEWELSNGSRVLAFPTTAGDSYTATLAIVDEADLVPDLDRLMRAVKPTIDGGGRMILLSRADKGNPQSTFKKVYRAAKQGQTEWVSIFLSWQSRPDRDAAWFDAQKQDIFHRTGSLDDLQEQYPATDTEALAARSLDKRIAPAWLHQCYQEGRPLAQLPAGAPAIPGLEVYVLPQLGRSYVIGADPAEGNPTSDDSALAVLDRSSGEEVASLAGKFQPAVFAAHLDMIAKWYGGAGVLVERNNHGHAVLLWLRDHSGLTLGQGLDNKDGWLTNEKRVRAYGRRKASRMTGRLPTRWRFGWCTCMAGKARRVCKASRMHLTEGACSASCPMAIGGRSRPCSCRLAGTGGDACCEDEVGPVSPAVALAYYRPRKFKFDVYLG
jgi:hypothetical protein